MGQNEILGNLISLVNINGADDSFQSVGENILACSTGIFRFASGEQEAFIDAKRLRHQRASIGINQGRAQRGQFSFSRIFKTSVKIIGNDQFQNGISKKLQALIMRQNRAPIFVYIRAMGKSLLQEALVFKYHSRSLFKF